jgi:hypothetical protein
VLEAPCNGLARSKSTEGPRYQRLAIIPKVEGAAKRRLPAAPSPSPRAPAAPPLPPLEVYRPELSPSRKLRKEEKKRQRKRVKADATLIPGGPEARKAMKKLLSAEIVRYCNKLYTRKKIASKVPICCHACPRLR